MEEFNMKIYFKCSFDINPTKLSMGEFKMKIYFKCSFDSNPYQLCSKLTHGLFFFLVSNILWSFFQWKEMKALKIEQ